MTSPILQTRTQQPGEAVTYTFEFADKLAVGDSLSGTPTVSIDPSGPTVGSPSRSGTKVLVRISGGTDGNDHYVQATCPTSNGDTLQIDMLLEIREHTS